MKAIKFEKKASPYKLVHRDAAKPAPSDNTLLIAVVTASVNAADYRSLKMGMIPKHKILGAAVSGKVEAVGKNIQSFKVGDEVLGDLSDFGFGGFAEYALAPEKALTLKPPGMSFDEAAAIHLAATTALKAVRDKGAVQPGLSVLIVGAAGGVGTFAVQMAKHYGAHVTAICSARNVEQTASLGADEVIDYTKEDFMKRDTRYDLILAINGNYSLLGYKRLLNPNGTYVMVGGTLSQVFKSMIFGSMLSLGRKKMKALFAKTDSEDLTHAVKLVEDGKIRIVIERRYPFEETPEAMDYVSQGHARAKVVVNIQK